GLVNVAGLQVFGIGLNQNHPALRKREVRQALNHAVDVPAIVTALFRDYATVLDSPLASKTDGHAACGEYGYDVAAARKLLADAGCETAEDGTLLLDGEPSRLRLRTPDGMYPADVRLAQVVQE